MASRPLTCPDCGGPRDHRATRCRKCHDQTMPTERRCTQCGLVKPVTEFRIRTRVTPLPRSHCKACESRNQAAYLKRCDPNREATRRWERNNPDKFKAQKLRRCITMLGLADQMNEIIQRVQTCNTCEICGNTATGPYRRLAIDHDHATGQFRGLLCESCNHGLGKFNDNPAILRAAAAYLECTKRGGL